MNKIIFTFVIVCLIVLFSNVDIDADAKSTKPQNSNIISQQNEHKIQVNKYANYVHFQPEWNRYPRNLIFDVTNIWNRTNTLEPLSENNIHRGAKTNINSLQYLEGKSYLEVLYDYIDCNYQWIHYAQYGLNIIGSKLDYATGKQKESNHNSAMFSRIPSHDSPDSQFAHYSQFIPICTSEEMTSFDYGLRIDDKTKGFDVYFVPSIDERYNYHHNPQNFTFFSDCYGLNYQSFSGTCHNVGKESGLLVIIADNLEKPLTKVSIKLKERLSQ